MIEKEESIFSLEESFWWGVIYYINVVESDEVWVYIYYLIWDFCFFIVFFFGKCIVFFRLELSGCNILLLFVFSLFYVS